MTDVTPPDIDDLVRAAIAAHPSAASWRLHAEPDDVWLHVEPDTTTGPGPPQGWKVRVGANDRTGDVVLSRAVPVLLSGGAPWKVVRSWHDLRQMNQALFGRSQVGKVITAYPRNDEEAVRLAAALDEVTRGLEAPPVPTDRRLRDDSIVSYRYGAFVERSEVRAGGRVQQVIDGADGAVVRDRRGLAYKPPAGRVDPFEAAGLAEPPPEVRRPVGGRYLPIAVLHQSPQGRVEVAVDLEAGVSVVLKRSYRGAGVGDLGIEAYADAEADALAALAHEATVPRLLARLDDGGDRVLVIELIEGPSLAAVVEQRRREAAPLRWDEIHDLAIGVAEQLEVLHRNDVVFVDLKAENVVVTDAGPRLVDFELAWRPGASEHAGMGSLGYASPQRIDLETPTVADDVHAFGALIWMLAAGVAPQLAPDPGDLSARPPSLVSPWLPSGLDAAVASLLAGDPADRPRDLPAVVALLDGLALPKAGNPPVRDVDRPSLPGPEPAARTGLVTSLRLGRSRGFQGQPVAWPDGRDGLVELGNGTAGALAVLAAVAGRDRGAVSPGELRSLADWLLDRRRAALPGRGLYVGRGGVAAAVAVAARALDVPDLGDRARDLWHEEAWPEGTEVFSGVAGAIVAGLVVGADVSSIAAGVDRVLDAAVVDGRGWWWPDADGDRVLPGYAHGAAGIADTLLAVYRLEPSPDVAEAITGAVDLLEGAARPSPFGTTWSAHLAGGGSGPYWCNGPAGIARFLLHVAADGLDPRAGPLADGALGVVAALSGGEEGSVCHGLAGSVELLAVAGVRDPEAAREARRLAALLSAHRVDDPSDGAVLWHASDPSSVSPSYLGGYAGICLALHMVDDPDLEHPLYPGERALLSATPGRGS